VDELLRLQAAGIDGSPCRSSISNELPFFIDRVLPLLKQAGLRQ